MLLTHGIVFQLLDEGDVPLYDGLPHPQSGAHILQHLLAGGGQLLPEVVRVEGHPFELPSQHLQKFR